MYSISEAAKRFNISVHTLRYYEKEGLTPFVNRDKNGIRHYSDIDINWIYMILCLRDADMKINQIRDYINLYMQGDSTVLKRQELMINYKTYVEVKRNNMNRCLELIDEKLIIKVIIPYKIW